MIHAILKKRLKELVLMLISVFLMAAPSFGATLNLVAKKFTTAMPDGATINMWGFVTDTGQACTEEPGWTVGPTASVTLPDTLTINLRNCLTEPISIVIPGQPAPGVTGGIPAGTITDGQGRQRITSFTAQAAAGGGTVTYAWTGLKPGTFLYQSGSHPAVQVQMGLYGPLQVYPATANQAYNSPSTAYTTEATLLYSEIDPTLHAAVAAGTYGTPPAPTSTIDYKARYFLINGQAFQAGQTPLNAGNANQTTLIRFLNAGLRSHIPTLLGGYMKVIAEDGNLYTYPKEQYSILLAAGKTIDALWMPSAGGKYSVLDSTRQGTDGLPYGGALAYLQVGGATITPKLAGLTSAGEIFYTTDLQNWTQIPGVLSQLVVGDLSGDGISDLAGLTSGGAIFYTTDLQNWTQIPGVLSQLVVGDFNSARVGDELAGLASDGTIWFTPDLGTWTQVPGVLSQLVAGDFNGAGNDDLAGLTSNGSIWFTTDLSTWTNIPGVLSQLVVGDFNPARVGDELAGLTSDGSIWYTPDLSTWTPVPGVLSELAK